jgi:hypothetical protein
MGATTLIRTKSCLDVLKRKPAHRTQAWTGAKPVATSAPWLTPWNGEPSKWPADRRELPISGRKCQSFDAELHKRGTRIVKPDAESVKPSESGEQTEAEI